MQPGGCAAQVLESSGTDRDHGLTPIHGRHLHAEVTKPALDRRHDRTVLLELEPESRGHRLARQVVRRRPQATAQHDQVGTLQSVPQMSDEVPLCIADDALAGERDTEALETGRQAERIGVESIGSEQLRTDGDHEGAHRAIIGRRPIAGKPQPGGSIGHTRPENPCVDTRFPPRRIPAVRGYPFCAAFSLLSSPSLLRRP